MGYPGKFRMFSPGKITCMGYSDARQRDVWLSSPHWAKRRVVTEYTGQGGSADDRRGVRPAALSRAAVARALVPLPDDDARALIAGWEENQGWKLTELTVHCKHQIHGIKASATITYDQDNNR
jgi:hypothetical protein